MKAEMTSDSISDHLPAIHTKFAAVLLRVTKNLSPAPDSNAHHLRVAGSEEQMTMSWIQETT